MSGAIIALRFSVPEPVGINATYKRGKGRRLYKSHEAVMFQSRLTLEAICERVRVGWPLDVWAPAAVRVTAQLYNTNHDADACTKIVRDAFNGILYQDDRIVSNGANEPPIKDDGDRRVEVTVELLAVRSADEALKLRLAYERRQVARFKAKLAKRKVSA